MYDWLGNILHSIKRISLYPGTPSLVQELFHPTNLEKILHGMPAVMPDSTGIKSKPVVLHTVRKGAEI
jgi:hypothetical protein